MSTSQFSDDPGLEAQETSKAPLGLGFLKTFTDKKLTRDGQPAKKRGPKPDAKPALTRRQELNRQAQRTHRERKEAYIKALEQEVLRLKENFSAVSRSKDSLAEENRQLKQLLLQHGIAWTGTGGVDDFTRNANLHLSAAGDGTSSGSISGSYANSSNAYSPAASNQLNSGANYITSSPGQPTSGADRTPLRSQPPQQAHQQQPTQPRIDYDQAGIDFVLTLERPCMDHLQFLVEQSLDPEGIPCGHALLASCPPDPQVYTDDPDSAVLFNDSQVRPADMGSADGQKTWDISKPDLANLMDLSKRLNLDGEITPVMAWGILLSHPRFFEFSEQDIQGMAKDLVGKVRCYGFGAVLEEFEVRDCIESVLYYKQDAMVQ